MAALDEISLDIQNETNRIGLVGETGCGKTSFINVLTRNGVIDTAKTSKPKSFPLPDHPNIKLWDLPGLGTALYPDSESYFEGLELEKKYKVLLLFTKTKLTTNAQSLILRLEAVRKPFVLIKSFIDVEEDKERKKQNDFNEKQMKEEICKMFQEILQHLGTTISGEKIFLISNIRPNAWDFDRLKTVILNELPEFQPTRSARRKDDLAFRLAKLSMEQKEEDIDADKEAWVKYFKKNEYTVRKIHEKGIDNVRKEIEKEFDSWRDIGVRMAIVGETGCGKSTFTNAIRGVEDVGDGQENIAETGSEKETTKKVHEYSYPNNPSIKIVDCPGIGTKNFPNIKVYDKKFKIESYDVFIIMTSNRFTVGTGDLVRKVKSLDKPFFFVRSKIDVDIMNEKRKKTFNEVNVLEKTKKNCLESLKLEEATVADNDIFLISSYDTEKWDLARLIKAINSRLPFHKRECFLFSTIIFSKDILREKVEVLRGKIWQAAFFRSSLLKLVTFTQYSRKQDFKVIVEKVKEYRSLLGFPESKELEEMSDKRRKELEVFFLERITDDEVAVDSWLNMFDPAFKEENTEPGGKDEENIALTSGPRSTDKNVELPPYFDVDEAKKAPYSFVSRTLHNVLDKMQEIAMRTISDVTAREQAKLDMEIERPRQENQQRA